MSVPAKILMLAARAAGYWSHEFRCVDKLPHLGWDPSIHKSDAVDLAEKLHMTVESSFDHVCARLQPSDPWIVVERKGNPNAWCHAVTLCAAKQGRCLMADCGEPEIQ